MSVRRLTATAEAAADRAGALLRAAFRTDLRSDEKPDRSPVTACDRAVERAIRELIESSHPGQLVGGEEYGMPEGARTLWVVDPIDGTRAFITGRPSFGTLIAFVEDGEPLLGVIDQPITGERWVGVRGERTRYDGRFGGRVGTRRGGGIAQAELSATAPEMFAGADRRRFERLAAACRRPSWGGDCYAYGLLALGQIDIVAEAAMKPWDWAALVPVVEGAGGAMTDWEGRRLAFDGSGEVLAVGDEALLEAAVGCLADG